MKLLMVGDVMLGRHLNEILKKTNPLYPWGNTLPIFQKADVRFCNLECVISHHPEPWNRVEKVFHFRTEPKNVGVLKAARIDAVSIANNHSMDYGPKALKEMIHILSHNHIGYAGAGITPKEAQEIASIEVSKKRVGFLAVTDNEPEWKVSNSEPGTYYVPLDLKDLRAVQLLKKIWEKKEGFDLIVVSVHWGPNWGRHPLQKDVQFAHALIDSGANIVFGHSPHVFRGVEFYKGCPILYSAGDFVDDYAVDEVERNDESFVFLLSLNEDGHFSLQLYPTVIQNFQAQLATGQRASHIASQMTELCREFETRCDWNASEGVLNLRRG